MSSSIKILSYNTTSNEVDRTFLHIQLGGVFSYKLVSENKHF